MSEESVAVTRAGGASSVVVVCEHASAFIPARFDRLGLSGAAAHSHVAWDPGALGVARGVSARLDAPLVAGTVSRLVYDCNRPPDAPDAMPALSEVIEVPGNRDLSAPEREARVAMVYRPFRAALAGVVARVAHPVIVTIHSFTPVFHGQPRRVEIGILHDSDSRLADAMLDCAARFTQADVQRNQPYGPADGVTHTLREHGVSGGHLNVMIEVRNDLIATPDQQDSLADMLADWLAEALSALGVARDVQWSR